MISNTSRSRAEATLESGGRESRLRLFLVRVVNYLTNHVVNHLPIFALRQRWYRSVLGVTFGEHAGVHLNCYVWFYSPGQIRRDGFRIGAFSRINRNCCLDVRGGLHIGDNVSISPDVMILTASHGIDDPEFRVETRPIVIEDYVYIGARATILPGVTLGRGCVVAACSTVTRDVPPLAIVAGVPAREVGTRSADALRYVLDAPFPLFE